jgi:hypothetical protein
MPDPLLDRRCNTCGHRVSMHAIRGADWFREGCNDTGCDCPVSFETLTDPSFGSALTMAPTDPPTPR